MNPAPRILIVQTAYLGDVILTIPLIQRLHEHLPEAQIDYLTAPRAANVIETNPYLRNVLQYDKYGWDKGILGFRRWVQLLRSQRYDCALIIHRSLRSALLVYMSGIKKRIGFSTSPGAWFMTDIIPYRQNIHEIDRNLQLLLPLEINCNGIKPKIYPTPEDKRAVDLFYKECALEENETIIGMAPGSAWATKRMPEEKYTELITMLARHKKIRTVLFGGLDDVALCNSIQQKTGKPCIVAAGRFTPRQTAAALRKVKILVTNDTGALHLGVAAPTRVIAVFGPTVRAFGFDPYGDEHRIVELPLPCRPCSRHGTKTCPLKHFKCMNDINSETIYNEIKSLIEKPNNDIETD